MSSKRVNIQGDAGSVNKRAKRTTESDTQVSSGEFKVLQAYRQLQSDITKGRAHTLRTGDINIVVERLNDMESLYENVRAQNNNNLFAQDSRTMVGISELAEISVRNLKLGETKSLINLDDMTGFCKRYMLKEYFQENQISETLNNAGILQDMDDNEEDEESSEDTVVSGENSTMQEVDKLKQDSLRKEYLKQFDKYNSFDQFNWFRMGALFNNLTKTVSTVDNLIGPFSIEKKVREKITKTRKVDQVGQLTTADRPTAEDLLSNDEKTTPEQVKRCFKLLNNKVGKGKSISLFKFIINPNSFAKSVENLFYTSFLIKEGRLVLEEDPEDGMPCIRVKESVRSNKDKHDQDIEKQKRIGSNEKHIIFQMDMPTWSKLIKKFNITSSFIDDNM